MKKSLVNIFLIPFLWICCFGQAQENHFLYKEIQQLNQQYKDNIGKTERIVFTGSSSIRMWKHINKDYPNHQIINTGFGGSKMVDLKLFLEDLVLQYTPSLVFVYEGDNDISVKQSPRFIKKVTIGVVNSIKKRLPNTKIVLISAKPSIARWHLKGKYKRLNRKFKRMAKKDSKVYYASVWKTMLKEGKADPTIFLSDGLHMNKEGYKRWKLVVDRFINL